MEVKHFIEVSSEEVKKLQNVANLLQMGVKTIQYDDVVFLKNLKLED